MIRTRTQKMKIEEKKKRNVYGTGISRERKIFFVLATRKTNFSLVC